MQGKLIIAGGNIDTSRPQVFGELIRSLKDPKLKVLVVVTASGSEPDDTFDYVRETLEGLGLKPGACVLLPLYEKSIRDKQGRNLHSGDAPGVEAYLDGVGGVWFTGGDQYFIRQCFVREDGSDTRLLTLLKDLYQHDGLVVGGSSAGAAMMSRTMIGEGNNRSVLHRETLYDYTEYDRLCEEEDPYAPLILTTGLGFFTLGVVDQHFDVRPRLLRLVEACMDNPLGQRMGYGVSEDTALCYSNGNITVLGASCVYVVDCTDAVKHKRGEYSGVRLTALQAGDSMDGETGQMNLAKAGEGSGGRFPLDYINNGILNSPVFDAMVIDGLLHGEADRLYTNAKTGLPYVMGCAAYHAEDHSYFVRLKYYKTPGAQGYLGSGGKASFTGAELETTVEAFTRRKE